MSVRAYRQVTEPELAGEATFNLRHDNEVYERLEELSGTKIMGGEFNIDFIELSVAALEELLQASPFDPGTMEAFQRDIRAAKEKDESSILYHCY